MSALNKLAQILERIWEKIETKSLGFRYGVAGIFVLIAFLLRLSQDSILADRVPFTFFITIALVTATLLGFRPGLFALLLGWLLADYFFMPPFRSFGHYGVVEVVTLISSLVPSILGLWLIELLHRTRRIAKAEIQSRKRMEADLVEAKRQVEKHARELEERVRERTTELENTVKFLEGFCYSIAHDLRAPVRATQGMMQALQDDYGDRLREGGAEYIKRIIEASQKMDKLVLDLLDFGRLSHEKIEFENVLIDSVLDDVLLSLREQLKVAEINVRRPLGSVRADFKLMKMILFHLVLNAVKFREPRRRLKIEIWTEERREHLRILIRDNGIGIEPHHQVRIFRLFETLQPSSALGTGAGLALVSKALERMRGAVGLHSQPGTGSTFWFDLPGNPGQQRSREPTKSLLVC